MVPWYLDTIYNDLQDLFKFLNSFQDLFGVSFRNGNYILKDILCFHLNERYKRILTKLYSNHQNNKDIHYLKGMIIFFCRHLLLILKIETRYSYQ